VDFLAEEHGAWFIGLGTSVILLAHLGSWKLPQEISLASFMALGALTVFVLIAFRPQPMSLGRIATLMYLYGTCIFILLTAVMQRGLAAWLTNKRGKHWVKELDYVYLTLGSFGIIAAINRLPFVTNKIEAGDIIAPVLLTTAVVIRFIKTRAEIGKWNMPPSECPITPPSSWQ
jgi:hypothetical protein